MSINVKEEHAKFEDAKKSLVYELVKEAKHEGKSFEGAIEYLNKKESEHFLLREEKEANYYVDARVLLKNELQERIIALREKEIFS